MDNRDRIAKITAELDQVFAACRDEWSKMPIEDQIDAALPVYEHLNALLVHGGFKPAEKLYLCQTLERIGSQVDRLISEEREAYGSQQ